MITVEQESKLKTIRMGEKHEPNFETILAAHNSDFPEQISKVMLDADGLLLP